MPDEDHPLAGRYLVYEVVFTRKCSDRFYWQGPDVNTWLSGPDARESAPRFPNPTAARAAVTAAEGDSPPCRTGEIGYEWEGPVIEQPFLPDPEAHP